MAFPQVGLDSVFEISTFEKNARKYNRTLDGVNKKTKRTADAMSKSSQKAGRDIFAWTDNLRSQMNQVEPPMKDAAKATDDLRATFSKLGIAAGIVTAGVGGALVVISKLLRAGEEAARLEDIRRAFINLAASSGVSARQLLSDLQEVSRGTIDTQTLLETANDALLAGGETLAAKLPQFLAIAQGAARATGKDVGFVFQTLVEGAIKGSPLLIDNAKVYIKLGNAIEAYADSVNKSVADLDAQERQFAVTNAILEQGGDFLDRLGDSAISAAEPFDQLRAQSTAFSTGLKTLVAPAATFVAKSLQGLLFAAKASVASHTALIAVAKGLGSVLRGEANVIDIYREKFDETFQTLQLGAKPIEDMEGGISGLGDAAQEAAQDVSELNTKLADLAEQRGERLAKIELQNARRDEDIAIQRGRQLEDADRKLGRRRDDMARSAGKARQDAARDNAKKLVEIDQENARRANEFVREAQRAREDLDRSHQERLFQINQAASDTIGEAARRNDAVAIAAALRQKQRELRDEQRGSQMEKADLTRDLQEKQQKIDEDATIAKQKQAQRFDEQLASLRESEAQQEESLKLSLQRQEEDRDLSWQRQGDDLIRARERQLEDLDAWYAAAEEKLKESLGKQEQIASQGVRNIGEAVAQAAFVSTEAINRTPETAAITQKGNFLFSPENLGSTGLSEEEQRLLRGNFLRRAEGGVDVVDRPTTFLAGEAGPEVAAFLPLRDVRAAHSFGDLNVRHTGIPGGITTEAMDTVVYNAIVRIAQRLRLN